MEQWQIILLVAFIALLRWIFRGGGLQNLFGGGDDEGQPPSQGRARKEETEEERVRKFMEALGVPPTQTPPTRRVAPPIAQKRPVIPRRAATKPAYFPKMVPPPPQPPPKPVEPPVAPAPAPVTAQTAAVEAAYQSETEFKTVVAPPASSLRGLDVRSLLKSPDSVRTAVILRELLGPPRSLQSFSSTPNVL